MTKKAFTLIELLVVIVIIGFLVSLVALSLQSIRAKSRDAKRVSDIYQIQTALELYRNDHNAYPSSVTSGSTLVSQDGNTTYIKRVPTAPSAESNCTGNNDYVYSPQNNQTSYTLNFCLGNAVGSNVAGYNVATPSGVAAESAPVAETPYDGDATITASKNLNSASAVGRSCGDAVAYQVSSLSAGSATLASTPAAGCLNADEYIVIYKARGKDSSSYANTGNYELLQIASVSSNVVNFKTNKTKYYGDTGSDDSNIGTAGTTNRVNLQRVPFYNDLTINNGVTVDVNSWVYDAATTIGGWLYIKVGGNLTNNGTISVYGKGYRGGQGAGATGSSGEAGQQGESFLACRTYSKVYCYGAGGGGNGNPNSANGMGGGGGAYQNNGTNGYWYSSPGQGGYAYVTYFPSDLDTRLLMGSGGGGGGSFNKNCGGIGYGGRGGGVLVIEVAGTFTNSGSVNANGLVGQGGGGQDCGGGGGGSGGTMRLSAASISLGSNTITATAGSGGTGDNNHNGGAGSVGRIMISSPSITGTTNPTYTSF